MAITCVLFPKSLSPKNYINDLCPDSFTRKNNTKQPPSKLFACSVCEKHFLLKCDLSEHMCTHIGEKPSNDTSENSFSRKYFVDKRHGFPRTIQIQEHLVACKICNVTLKYDSLKNHMQVHSSNKQFNCDLCEKSFSRKESLLRHCLYIHDKAKKKNSVSCDICKKSLAARSDLTSHMRIHTGEKPFKCDFCPKVFTWRHSLKNHLRIHTGEKPYSCDVCGESYTQEASLKRHHLIHSSDKPFTCNVCQKSFRQKCNFDQHFSIHTGEKTYKCEECQKTFFHKYNLKRHLVVHIRKKPFKCSVCQKGFLTKGYFKKHIMMHEQTLKTLCSQLHLIRTPCDQRFQEL